MKTVIWGLMIPFIGTAGGAACVFFLKNDLKIGVQRALTGFAAGVMVAASIWSLIVPAIEQSAAKGRWAFLPAFIGFWFGILFLLLLDHLIPHLHRSIDHADQAEGPKANLNRTIMMVLAVTLHNIPEGMAVGVVYAGLLAGSGNITAGGALALALGIAIQNFPEGAIISMPLYAEGKSKPKSFGLGVLSGAVEPIFGGADLRRTDCTDRKSGSSRDAVSFVFRSGSHAVCGCGRADSGDVRRCAFKYRRCIFCRRIQPDDGAGCGAGVTGIPFIRGF